MVLITNIGDGLAAAGGDPLVCATQRIPCCAIPPHRSGQWFYPNGTYVLLNGYYYHFYRYRRDSDSVNGVLGGVLLNRRFGAVSPTGIYNCVITGADGTDQFLYVGLYTNTNNGKHLKSVTKLAYIISLVAHKS